MKALILNSGLGKRMGELTRNKPKCLVGLGSRDTILDRQIRALRGKGIQDIVITTGPFPGQIKEHLGKNYPGVNFIYIHNPLYKSTNYIYSMFLAGDTIDKEVILMHGDLVFEESLLERLLEESPANSVLVNKRAELPHKDFKARVKGGRVREISVDISSRDCFMLMPLYRLEMGFWQRWLEEIKAFKEAGQLKVYAEEALNKILGEEDLYPYYFDRELCQEIDDTEDLERVKKALEAQEA